MEAHSIRFHGRLLERGFWLYVIDIRGPKGRCFYVGRTGDSSSPNAGSPFARIGQHLDRRPNAKGNALGRNLAAAGIEASACAMEMLALGPLFPEERDFAKHRPVRDQMAALERGVAEALRQRGYTVLGTHGTAKQPNSAMLDAILGLVESCLLKEGEPQNNQMQRTAPAQAMERRR